MKKIGYCHNSNYNIFSAYIKFKKIYEVFPESIKISIKDRMISAYSNFNDKTKIIIRALN